MPNLRRHAPTEDYDLRVPLHNLSHLSIQMDALHRFISQSITTHTLLTNHHMDLISNEILSAIRHLIINAAAILAATPPLSDGDIVELDAVELLATNFRYFCEICGKGFTREANLRMHKRAHGDRFKTPDALLKNKLTRVKETRFSCPFEGCKRNRMHEKFRPLKSVFCLKNHFKRSHCPKTLTCDRCRKKKFSMLSDLKSHAKQCMGESTWMCTCGTTFSGKEKLFGHVALFDWHSPAIEEKEKRVVEGVNDGLVMKESECFDGLPEGFFDGLDPIQKSEQPNTGTWVPNN